MGYAGLHTAVAFGQKMKVIGFDIDPNRVLELNKHTDSHKDFTDEELKSADIFYTSNPQDLELANFHIIVVPTPINFAKEPDLFCLESASTIMGRHLKRGDVIVYESTVYPGATEEVCIPILERESSLVCGKDFYIGYSPERINPGDKVHKFYNTKKIVSGCNAEVLKIITAQYSKVVQVGVHCVSSIKAAEAVKVIENTQRDINIAFMNEIAQVLHGLNLDTQEILQAAKTKWNFLPFEPGLVGGHCIGVDAYYLIHKMHEINFNPELMIAARRINDSIVQFIFEQVIKHLILQNIQVNNSRIAILGLTYKEDCVDIRNSRVFDLIKIFQDYQIDVQVSDPIANSDLIFREYGIKVVDYKKLKNISAIIVAVAHEEFKLLQSNYFKKTLVKNGLIVDIKSIFPSQEFKSKGLMIWQL